MKHQADTLILTSRAFYNDQLGLMSSISHNTLDLIKYTYDTGAEAVETAIKNILPAYKVKGIPGSSKNHCL